VLHTKKEPHWWTRAPDGDTAVKYVLANYFTASKDVHEAYLADRSQLVFGDASASTFWQLHHRPGADAGGGPKSAAEVASPPPQLGASGGNPAAQAAQAAQRRSPTVPALLRAVLPKARLIVCFRNPGERALSE
jgi:hypothetical protein